MRRAGRILSSLFGVAAPRGPLGRTVRACLLFALLAWSLEVGFAFEASPLLTVARVRGLVAGLGLSLLGAAIAGVVIGVFGELFAEAGRQARGPAVAGARGRLARVLWERDAAAQRARVGGVLGALPLAALFCAAAFAVTRSLILGMAQPHFAAVAIVAAHLALLLLAAAVFPGARDFGIWIARGLERIPGVRVLAGSVGVLLSVLFLLAVVFAVAVLAAFWETFAFMPWRAICVVAGGALGALLVAWVGPHLGTGVLVAGRALRALIVLAALLVLATLDARGEASRRAVHETASGRLGQVAMLQVLDFDRDGSLHLFGGGDCAPFDRRVGPLMVDVPNNGRDEDCDGTDLDERRLGVELKRNFPLPEAFPKRPPIVLVTIDTFAAGRMQALGYGRSVTPRLDAFAKRSVLFRYGFAQGPSTRLSFPSMFTSRWDSQIEQKLVGSHPYPIAESELMLAEVLTGEGYDATAIIPDGYFRKSRWGSLTSGFRQVIDSPSRSGKKHNSAAVTDAALAVLKKQGKKPPFLWVHYYDAHSPHVQPTGEPKLGKSRADVYDAELRLVDREVGRLLDGIEQKHGQGALIFVTGDHGIAFEAPRHAKFNYGYDLSSVVLHVPLIVHGPLLVPAVMDGVVSTMDIAPTIANLLGVRRKLPFEGASLLPELLENRRVRPERIVHQFYLEERLWKDGDPLEQISLRTGRYNLIHNRQTGTFELYDWRKDYFEASDLADEPAHRATLKALRQQLALLTYRVYGRERSRAASLTLGKVP